MSNEVSRAKMSNGELIPLETASPSLLHESHSPSQPQEEGEQQSPSLTNTPEGETESTRHKGRNIITVAVFFVASVLANAAYSLMSPFFPQRAKDKGATPIAIGLVIGAAPLSVGILSPVVGIIFNLIGARLLVFLGLLLIGASYTLMAFVSFIPVTWLFILVTFLLRIIEGCGSAMFLTATLVLIPALFPKYMGTLVGLINMAAGVGYALGFPLGGALYQLGGFQLPFASIGIPLLLMIIPCVLLLRKTDIKKKKKESLPVKGMCGMLADAIIIVLFTNMVISSASLSFVQPTLEIYMVEHFGLSPALVSVSMLIAPLSYFLAALFVGLASDKVGHHRYFSVGGMALLIVGYFVLSLPVYFKGFPQYWSIFVLFINIGAGGALGIVTIYADMINQVKMITKNEIEQEVFSPFISGLVSSSMYFGEFGGSLIGGTLKQFISVPLSALVFIEIALAQTILILTISLIEYYTRTNIHISK